MFFIPKFSGSDLKSVICPYLDKVSFVFTNPCFILIWRYEIQGVPINMGIQWRIRYRLFKWFLDLVKWYLLRKLWSVKFSSAMFIVCLFMFRLHTVVLSKSKKIIVYKQSKHVRIHCSSWGDIMDTSLQPFTVFIK